MIKKETKKGDSYRRGCLVGYEEGFSKAMKACGNCDNCYGKGYSTERTSYSSRRSTQYVLNMNFCDCGRGKQLKELLSKKSKLQKI